MSRIDFVTGAPEKYAHLVDALATVPDRVRATVEGYSDTELRRGSGQSGWSAYGHGTAATETPANGGADAIPVDWSAHRVLLHLALYAHDTGVFIHRMVTMTDPERILEDEEVLVAERGLLDATPQALLDELEREVGKTVDFLAETPDAAWGRRGMVRGMSRSVRQQVQRHIDHFEEHIEQIESLLGAREGVETGA